MLLCYNSLFMKLYGCVCVHVFYRTYSLVPVVHISIFAEYLCLSIYTLYTHTFIRLPAKFAKYMNIKNRVNGKRTIIYVCMLFQFYICVSVVYAFSLQPVYRLRCFFLT